MDQQTQLVCPAHTTQYAVTLIVGLVIGIGASFIYSGNTSGISYQAGFDAAKKSVLESQMGMMFRTPDDIRTISGTVTAVSGNRVTLHVQSANPFEDPALLDRTITVATDTKISTLTQKDPKVMQTEMETFMKTMQSGKGGAPITPPELFTHATATVTNITVGDTLNITTVENIKTVKEFSASEIQIQPKQITN